MSKYMLLATLGNRFDDITIFMKSFNQYIKDWKLIIISQEYSQEQINSKLFINNNVQLYNYEEKLGMHGAKVEGLKIIDSFNNKNYVVCSVDDDMEFIKETNYNHMVNYITENLNVGLASATWGHCKNILKHRILDNKVIKQNIVYTGGGLLFRKDVAKLIMTLPNEKYFSDNTVWSTLIYVKGYDNVRIRSSLAIHRVCRKGGRKSFVDSNDCHLYKKSLIKFEESKSNFHKNNSYNIGTDKGLTENAHNLHKYNKKIKNAAI